jgi:hypothetical protein
MPSAERDGASGAGADERDVGWGGREWAEGRDGREGTGGSGDSEDPELERLRADRPPHHEERER